MPCGDPVTWCESNGMILSFPGFVGGMQRALDSERGTHGARPGLRYPIRWPGHLAFPLACHPLPDLPTPHKSAA